MAEKNADTPVDQKRAPKPTERAVEEKIQRLKDERRGKLAQLTKQRNNIETLKQDECNVDIIKEETLLKFERCFGEYKRLNEELCELLSEDDQKVDQETYESRHGELKAFIQETNKWIASVKRDSQDEEDDVRPHDSVSVANSVTSRASQRSGTSSARLKLKAEREALLARAAAMKIKQELEQEEVRLRVKKEQLQIETELAASNAKLKVYEEFEDAHEPMDDFLDPVTRPRAGFQYLTDRKEKSTSKFYEHRGASEPLPAIKPKAAAPAVSSVRRKSLSRPMIDNAQNSDSTDDLYQVLQRQNEVTEMLIKQQSLSQLPHRDIPVFTGDPLTYRSFIRAFEHAIDSKTDSQQDRLYYLEQFTSGEPLDLIRSCEHMRPDRAYREARALLDRHYGDELIIANAYIKKAMEWPQIKPEDRKGLNTFALFLIGCCNTVNDVDYMDEMNNPTNMKCILSKLPFKLKDKWRSFAYDIQDRRKKRARFPDLVDFVYHQAKVVNDPLFGDILDITSGNQGNTKKKANSGKGESKRSSFAVSVSTTNKDTTKGQPEKKPALVKSANAFQSPCLYCKKNHTLNVCNKIKDQPLKERIEFLKSQGLCFGCLTAGHLSKDCKKKSSCPDCSFKHPAILHVVKEDPTLEKNSADDNSTGTAEVTNALVSAGCGRGEHTGAGNNACILPIVPVQIRRAQESLKRMHSWIKEAQRLSVLRTWRRS